MSAAPAPNDRVDFDVLLERDDIVAVSKPRGVATEPGPGHQRTALLNGLVHRWPEMRSLGAARDYGLLHRLDRDTSGVVIAARTAERYDELRDAFTRRAIDKRYLAVTRGRLSQRAGTCTTPLSRVRRAGTLISVPDPSGSEAVTHWSTLAADGDLSLLEVRIETGRTHQIRVHLALQGAAVEGDRVYRPLLPPNTSGFKDSSDLRLHAWSLNLTALRGIPEGLQVVAPIPPTFCANLPVALLQAVEGAILPGSP